MAAAGQSVRVLVVEDEPKLAFAVRVLLELDSRITVVGTAANGVEAIDAALALQPDVIVLDVQMPLLDGIAAATRILAEWPAARIVLYSGEDAELARGREIGVHSTLRKGQLVESLVDAVHAAAAYS